jgi:hypothetical protein
MNDISNIADHASQQNDRWLFIVCLILMVIFALVVWRWIVADREKIAQRLTEVTDRHITSCEKLGEVVANNTIALNAVNDAMRRCNNNNR